MNPVDVLLRAGARRLGRWANDRALLRRARAIVRRWSRQPATSAPEIGQSLHLFRSRGPVAYLSMEFAVHPSLPFYAGGLGILAGDHLKSASDLGLPLIGVGLAYRRGYYRQEVDATGDMRVVYPRLDYDRMPMELVRDAAGREIRVTVDLPATRSKPRRVELRAWRITTGRTQILLLDSDHDANARADRALCQFLYGGSREDRIAQEILAGIGGVKLLRALDIEPSVWHLNEGHVTFSTLERLRVLREEVPGLTNDEAIEIIASRTVFTTHTPVPEGNEVFDLGLARRYLAAPCAEADIDVDDYLGLGLDHDSRGKPLLSMTVLAMHLSRMRNGVSALHGQVSREMWRRLWPGVDTADLPIGSVTNGVHVPTWISPEMDELFRRFIDTDWRSRQIHDIVWKRALKLPDREIWSRRRILRERLIEFVRVRVAASRVREGANPEHARTASESLLDPDALTIGFARRFALYKRAALLFRDRKAAAKLFSNPRRKIQIIFAGKPHPEDPEGKKLFEEIVAISRKPAFRGKVVVLENYDMDIGRAMVQGADVWLNNPRRPLEASGTSGQKVSFNGGLNASILDGWWDEGFRPELGWSFGERRDFTSHAEQDRDDSRDLLALLSRQIVPLFYDRDRSGRPRDWLKRVKRAMVYHVDQFSSDRMVSDYACLYYAPTLLDGELIESRRDRLTQFVDWKSRMNRVWPLVHVREVTRSGPASKRRATVEIFAAGLETADVGGEALVGGESIKTIKGRRTSQGAIRFQFALPSGLKGPINIRFVPTHPYLFQPFDLGLCLKITLE